MSIDLPLPSIKYKGLQYKQFYRIAKKPTFKSTAYISPLSTNTNPGGTSLKYGCEGYSNGSKPLPLMGTVSWKTIPLIGTIFWKGIPLVETLLWKSYPYWGQWGIFKYKLHLLGIHITIGQFDKYIAVTVFCCEFFYTLYHYREY